MQGQVFTSECNYKSWSFSKGYYSRDGSDIILLSISVFGLIGCANGFLMHCVLQFNKEAGHEVEECKLRVVYVARPGPPSPVREESEEGSSPRASVLDNGNYSVSEQSAVSV